MATNQFTIRAYVTMKKGDTVPSLTATMQQGGAPIDLGSASVRFVMMDSQKRELVNSPASVLDAENGLVEYDWEPSDTAVSGTYYGEFRIDFGAGDNTTVPNDGYILITII